MAARFNAAIDGGSRGNPGKAAWGVAVLDEAGNCVEGFAGRLGEATNNVAEYTGLLHALEIALERGAQEVRIASDSELLVRQIQGRYKVRNAGLRPLYRKAKSLISRLALFRIVHVRREQNVEADSLVNQVLDDPEGDGTIHEVYDRA